MQRRELLRRGTAAGIGALSPWLPVGRSAWAAAGPADSASPRRLIVVFMRGAVDGLSVVVPYSEGNYYRARSSIALGRPGSDDGVLDLDGRFGLHPALASLMPLWDSKRLGFVQASGSPDPTRSHFDAQDYMESGTPGRKATPDGWLNRMAAVLPMAPGGGAQAARAVSVGPVLPRIYAGHAPVASIASGATAARPTLLDRPRIDSAFSQLYNGEDPLSTAYQQGRAAHREVMNSMASDDLQREMKAADNGAPLPNGFPDDAAQLATLMRKDPHVQLAFMAVGGWDTHANQGAAKGQLANRLLPLGQGLAALASGLGPAFDDSVIVVVSEFGRTVQQNGNGGTDHGHGNVMWLLGGPVAGGVVHGRWPGLEPGALHEGRDLAVTTDFREVLWEVSQRHLRLSPTALATVFPDFSQPAQRSAVLAS